MGSESIQANNVVGRHVRARREELRWSQERLGVMIGIDESSARARISRYELGVHEPPLPTARLIAHMLGVPLSYLYCEDEKVAELLLALHQMKPAASDRKVMEFLEALQTPNIPNS